MALDFKLPEFNFSQWWSEQTAGIELPDFSQLWADFNASDLLPDIDILGWFNETFANIEMPDISSLLPDFSSLGATISESLSNIPTTASTVFSSISTSASETLSNIQSEWSQLPSFFDGLWSGAGSAASAAGSAIASGLNSAIGTIQSAWEGLSSWLSAKISSLASMASNAVSAVTSFVGGGGIGHNATGTASWRGGFTEINEQGGEIIDLPSGARIYPHATTMKMLQQDMANGELDGLGGYSSEGIDVGGLSAFPQAPQIDELTSGITNTSTSTTNTNNNNNGVNITGNTFNVRAESDIDKIAFRLFEMMSDSNANYVNA